MFSLFLLSPLSYFRVLPVSEHYAVYKMFQISVKVVPVNEHHFGYSMYAVGHQEYTSDKLMCRHTSMHWYAHTLSETPESTWDREDSK